MVGFVKLKTLLTQENVGGWDLLVRSILGVGAVLALILELAPQGVWD